MIEPILADVLVARSLEGREAFQTSKKYDITNCDLIIRYNKIWNQI